jgi:hypothetical protein
MHQLLPEAGCALMMNTGTADAPRYGILERFESAGATNSLGELLDGNFIYLFFKCQYRQCVPIVCLLPVCLGNQLLPAEQNPGIPGTQRSFKDCQGKDQGTL